MQDYEIRDTLRRATTPELYVELAFASGSTAQVEPAYQSTISKPIMLIVIVRNRSLQPAHYALVQIGIDTNLPLQMAQPDFTSMAKTDNDQHWISHQFMSPPDLPIFKEIDQEYAAHRLSLTFAYPQGMGGEHKFHVTTSVQTAGYTATENWVIIHRGGVLRLQRVA
jgi:hypothetical protein